MTIKDIARLAGVSVSTVSRVLNEHPDVSPPIREKVLEVVKEHHFIPNSTARNLVRPRRNCVGVVCRGWANPFYPPIVTTIERELNKAGVSMCLRMLELEADELSYGAELERAERLQGIIFLGGRADYTAAEVNALTVPFVCCSYTNCFGDVPAERYSSVTIDDQEIMRRTVNYLYEMGHREIAMLSPAIHDRSITLLRYQGYCKAMEQLGLPVKEEHIIYCDGFQYESGYAAVKEVCEKGVGFTAMVAASDMLAIAAIKALCEKGYSVPEDCSVVGIDGLEVTKYTLPTLTTLVQPQHELGEVSARLVLSMIDGTASGQQIVLEPELRIGQSVRDIR